jgi:hypothetical protein
MFCRFGAGPGFRKPRRKCPGLDVDETGINEPPVNLMVGFARTQHAAVLPRQLVCVGAGLP